MAAIIIPAHDEATVIGRCLDALREASAGGLRPGIRVVVACNGCSDDTAAVARAHGAGLELTVLELPVASKQAALNAAESTLGPDDFPRVHLDADVVVPAASVHAVLDVLEAGAALAARPPLHYASEGASPLVRAYYRARTRTPELMGALWGAGFYAVSREGRSRWDDFPLGVPDDLFVDGLFTADEKLVVDCAPVVVRVPRTPRALLHTLRRVHRAPEPVEGTRPVSTLRALLDANHSSPSHLLDALAYVAFSVAARAANWLANVRGHAPTWERDDTTR